MRVPRDDGRMRHWIYEPSGATSLRRLTNAAESFQSGRLQPARGVQSDRECIRTNPRGEAKNTKNPPHKHTPRFCDRRHGTNGSRQDTAHVPESCRRTESSLLAVTKGSRTTVDFVPAGQHAVRLGDVQSVFLPAASFSPDGRWVTYTVGKSPNDISVFVQPFPSTGSKYLVTATGIHPFWSPDGKELLYRWRGQTFAVSVTTEPTFAFGNPMPVNLCTCSVVPGRREIDQSEGKHFVGRRSRKEPDSAGAGHNQVVLTLVEELKRGRRIRPAYPQNCTLTAEGARSS